MPLKSTILEKEAVLLNYSLLNFSFLEEHCWPCFGLEPCEVLLLTSCLEFTFDSCRIKDGTCLQQVKHVNFPLSYLSSYKMKEDSQFSKCWPMYIVTSLQRVDWVWESGFKSSFFHTWKHRGWYLLT